jgi:hypothetical protein
MYSDSIFLSKCLLFTASQPSFRYYIELLDITATLILSAPVLYYHKSTMETARDREMSHARSSTHSIDNLIIIGSDTSLVNIGCGPINGNSMGLPRVLVPLVGL